MGEKEVLDVFRRWLFDAAGFVNLEEREEPPGQASCARGLIRR